jgi:uncharacterized membrane protein
MPVQLFKNFSNFRSFFRSKRQFHVFFLLSLSTIFSCCFVFFRNYYTNFDVSALQSFESVKQLRGTQYTFFFLIWNLFLAWVPFWIALGLDFWSRARPDHSRLSAAGFLVVWLLFFPNAPYILTDLLHLKDRGVVPHWFDLMMIASFAWTGLLLGYCSLFEIQRYLDRSFGQTAGWLLTVFAIFLAGFGVYMGRFQRWNSWDALTHPFALVRQQAYVLTHPFENLATLGVAVSLSVFMLIGYLTLNALRSNS